MPKCQHCNEPIQWKKTVNNKTMPVELEPINIVPCDDYDTIIVTLDGKFIKGKIVGDSNEQGYYIGYELHNYKSPSCKK